MAQVKCNYCKEKTDKSLAYKVPKDETGRRFIYYCSEEEYEKFEYESEIKRIDQSKRESLIDYICQTYLEYEEGMKFPTYLTKQLSELRKYYDYDVIKRAMFLAEDTIMWAMKNKDFQNDFGKIRYIIVLIEGNVNKVVKEMKQQEKEDNQVKHTQSFDYLDIDEVNTSVVKKDKSRNILDFLGEEDL